MKTSNLFAFLALATMLSGGGGGGGCAATRAPVRVMSFNVRVAVKGDGPNQWLHRRDAVAAMLRDRRPDVLGLQEATRPQIADLEERLEGYTWVGTGREGGDDGEFCPIFYRPDRFELLDKGNFWVSEQPERPSYGWDAAYLRIATWAKLRDRRTHRRLVMLNTHLDNRGDRARSEGARLILRRLREVGEGLPIIMTADLNVGPDSDVYRLLTRPLRDSRVISELGHTGPVETFTGFRGRPRAAPAGLIDYILVSPNLRVRRTETLASDWDGRQLSDHRAVLADVDL